MSGYTLPALIQQAADLESRLAESGGELTPEVEAALSKVELIPEKVDAYAFILDRLKSATAYWQEEYRNSRAIAEACEKARDRLKLALKMAMKGAGLTDLNGVNKRFKLSDSGGSLVIDEGALPATYLMEVVTLKPDKERIRAALEAGEKIPGAQIVPGTRLAAYANKANKTTKELAHE